MANVLDKQGDRSHDTYSGVAAIGPELEPFMHQAGQVLSQQRFEPKRLMETMQKLTPQSKPQLCLIAVMLLPLLFVTGFTAAQESANGDVLTESENLLPDGTNEIDRIVAIAEEEVLLESELQMSINGVLAQVKKRGGEMPPADLLRKQALERMIMNKLQVQRAQETGIRISESDVDQALANVAAQNKITILQLREALERDGFEFMDFRDELRDELIIARMRERVADTMPDITDTEIEIMLASDRIGGDQYDLSHVLVGVPDGATPDQVKQAQEKVDEVYSKLQEGLEFAAAAISYSDAQDALEGGHIGLRNISTMPTVFNDAVEKLQPGEFTRPLRSSAGFHILYLNSIENQSQIIVDESKVRHLMVATSDRVNSEEAYDRIVDLRKRWQQGDATFEELAREYSDDPMTANLGGDMGWVQPVQYGDRIKQIVDSLETGQACHPFQDEVGWHVMLVEDRRKSDVTDLALRNQAKSILKQQKSEREYETFLRQLRDESYVEIRG